MGNFLDTWIPWLRGVFLDMVSPSLALKDFWVCQRRENSHSGTFGASFHSKIVIYSCQMSDPYKDKVLLRLNWCNQTLIPIRGPNRLSYLSGNYECLECGLHSHTGYGCSEICDQCLSNQKKKKPKKQKNNTQDDFINIFKLFFSTWLSSR